VAADGREALRRVDGGERFDVLVSDVMMPGMSGAELCDELLRRGRDGARQMVFVTAAAAAAAPLRNRGLLVLEKPFDPAALRDAVARRTGGGDVGRP
jgi:CheY-like chemotaxis protein